MATSTIFENLAVGAEFEFNGSWYFKRSSRTAELLDVSGRWFYFSSWEVVTPTEQP